jgi:hypothetical protein
MPIEETISAHQNISKQSTLAVPVTTTPAVAELSPPAAPSGRPFNQDPPFADFVGRCFLRVCLWGDTLASLARGTRSSVGTIESAASERQDSTRPGWLRSFVGAASCTLAAASLMPVFSTKTYRPLVPFILLFVISFIVISFIALRFGDIAGVAGTICAALLFATILFGPTGFRISNSSERNPLISMVILGVCVSELLGRRKGAKGA